MMPITVAALLVISALLSPACSPSESVKDKTNLPASCKSACDCKAGFACLDGQCRSGTEAVYCCEACPPNVPQQQACQRRDQRYATCGTSP